MRKLQWSIILGVSIGIAVIPLPGSGVDFQCFYAAGQAVLHGVNPYTLPHYFNPLQVALAFAPLSLLPYDIALRLWSGLMFLAYAVAVSRLFNPRLFWLAMLAPFGMLIAYYGNFDALVLLGITLPAPIGVWLLLAKPQIGLFAAALMLWQYRSWRLTAAVVMVMIVSLALGMIHSGLNTAASVGLWPFGLLAGLPLLYLAWRRHDSALALGAAAFVSPYMTALNWCAALPLFRINRRVMAIGVALSWVVFVVWRTNL